MARSTRQLKILELISKKEISSQDELVAYLKAANFDITQATISRDIKELGLIKIATDDGKYKYSTIQTNEQNVSSKNSSIFKELVVSVSVINNLCIVKTVAGFGYGICSLLPKLNIGNIIGSTCGSDTVSIVLESNELAKNVCEQLIQILN